MIDASNTYESPYFHRIIDNFLPDHLFAKMQKMYSEFKFNEIQTDLFKFLQTNELSQDLDFFKDQLDTIFSQYTSLDDRYYDIFASYYRKGDYLLCHDDLIDNRVYAFTFYLSDFESGDLILYENDCCTINKRVGIKSNRLVIFKVGSKSFHEVDICRMDGRSAFTGWFNVPKKLDIFNTKHYFGLKLFIPTEDKLIKFDFPLEVPEFGEIQYAEFEDIEENIISKEISGPFIDRRCYKLSLDTYIVPNIEGYKLISYEYLEFDKDSYILCNDKINNEEGTLLDIFIYNTEGEVTDYIRYVNGEGEVEFSADILPGHMMICKRKDMNICILRANNNVKLKHLIYKMAE